VKYVDDTTTSEIVANGAGTNCQIIANTVAQWSSETELN